MRLQNAAALCASFPPDVRGQPYRVSPGISDAWSDLGLRERNAMELEQGNGEIVGQSRVLKQVTQQVEAAGRQSGAGLSAGDRERPIGVQRHAARA
jgi:hypothetical protein